MKAIPPAACARLKLPAMWSIWFVCIGLLLHSILLCGPLIPDLITTSQNSMQLYSIQLCVTSWGPRVPNWGSRHSSVPAPDPVIKLCPPRFSRLLLYCTRSSQKLSPTHTEKRNNLQCQVEQTYSCIDTLYIIIIRKHLAKKESSNS